MASSDTDQFSMEKFGEWKNTLSRFGENREHLGKCLDEYKIKSWQIYLILGMSILIVLLGLLEMMMICWRKKRRALILSKVRIEGIGGGDGGGSYSNSKSGSSSKSSASKSSTSKSGA
uniref:Small integral membrane protein 24 n=1 Tax=Rhabditophanes sp. KR3021 TaxID=114890 RepID=A0AC35TQ50_9BILA